MQSIRQVLTAAAGLVIVVAAVGVISSEPARAAKTDEVRVVNTAAEPVPTVVTNSPLPVAGTVTAHIDNATLPVSGTVAVSSLPAVTLSGTPQVSLSNTASTPLFVDTGGPTRSAIGSQCFANFDATGSANCLLATVPSNHTLVIETITCTASVANGTPLVPIVLNMGGPPIGGGPPISLNHRLLMTHAASIAGGLDYYGLTSQVRMYAAGGNGGSTGVSVGVGVGPGSANQGGLGCAISGHMASQ